MNMRELEKRGVVETGDDSTHAIKHTSDVPFINDSNNNYIKDMLHVHMIMKNPASVGHIVEQEMTV